MMLSFDFKVKYTLVRVFNVFLFPAHNYFFICHWFTIFGTFVYYHETLCRVHLWSRFDSDLWPQGQIYRLFSCLCVRPTTPVCFDIGISYLAHASITIRECVTYIHDPDMKLTFDLKVKFIGSMTWLCVSATAFLSFYIPGCHIILGPWVYHHGTMCREHWWPLYDLETQYQNHIFYQFESGKIVCSLT